MQGGKTSGYSCRFRPTGCATCRDRTAHNCLLDDALQALPGPGALPLLRGFHLHLGLFKTRMSRSTCQGPVLASKEFVSQMMPRPVSAPSRLSATVAIYDDLQRGALPWTLCQCLVGSLQNCGV